jgi:hypothetical protein
MNPVKITEAWWREAHAHNGVMNPVKITEAWWREAHAHNGMESRRWVHFN